MLLKEDLMSLESERRTFQLAVRLLLMIGNYVVVYPIHTQLAWRISPS